MTSSEGNTLEPTVEPRVTKTLSELLAKPLCPEREAAIERESQRLKERRSSIPFYAKKAKRDGDAYWRQLAASYQGDD